jgi:RNA polymerase sigma factor (sigma-70 family)
MARTPLAPVLHYLRTRLGFAAAEVDTDGQLLRRFAGGHDETAFEALLRRHGPLVWGVCRRVLAREPDAEDAFQATFLVLVRKAASVRKQASLASWLYGVAHRIALKARADDRRRCSDELGDVSAPQADALSEAAGREVQAIVEEEILQLPERLRAVVVLCGLEGRSKAEAARQLGWKEGTVASRLARARQRLRGRLARRGVTLPAGALGLLAVEPAGAAVPAKAAAAVLRLVALCAAGEAVLDGAASTSVTALAKGALQTMAVTKLKIGLTLAVAVCALAAGVGWATHQILAVQEAEAKRQDGPKTVAAKEAPPQPEAEPSPRFLDPDAGPLPADAVARIGSPRLRHAGDVTELAYSPDGKWLASVSTSHADATARVWDAATGKEQLRVPVTVGRRVEDYPRHIPRALGFSADAKKFLVVDTASVRAFDIASGKEQLAHRFAQNEPIPKGLLPLLNGAAFAPDGKTFVLAWNDGRLEIRDIATGAVRHTGEHPFKNYSHVPVEFSADGRRFVISGDTGKPVPVFEAESGRKVAEVRAESWRISQVRFLPDGDTLAVLLAGTEKQYKRAVGFYGLKAEKLLRTADVDITTYAIAVSRDGKLIFAGNGQKEFSQLLDAETGKEVGRVRSTPSLSTLAFSPDSKQVAGARPYSGAITVWDVATRSYHPTAAEPIAFFGATFAPDGRRLILRYGDYLFVDWRTGVATRRLPDIEPDSIRRGGLSPDGKLVAVAAWKEPIRLLDTGTGKEVRKLTGATASAGRMTFSGDGRRLASVDWDKVIRVWDVAGGQELAQFKAPELHGSDSLDLSDDGRVLAVTCNQKVTNGNVLYTWDVNAKVQLARIEAPSWFDSPAALSPDGRLLAGGGGKDRRKTTTESAVMIWDAATGQVIHSLAGHSNQSIHAGSVCAFSPDGRLLATGDSAGRLRLWEVASGQEVYHFQGHRTGVTAHFSPDGKLLVAASEDAPCYIWDVTGTARDSRPAGALDHDKLWADLASGDAKGAFQAVRRLVAASGPAVELIRRNLKPATAVDKATVDKLLRDLDADAFSTREAATAALLKLVDRIEPRLRAARETAAAEAQRRLDDILEKGVRPAPGRLRESRALMALEWIATPEAVQFLDELAGGAKDDPLTHAAVAARERLRKRAAR